MKILVLGGGRSYEREVSLRSAANVTEALRAGGYEVMDADPGAVDFDMAALAADCDAIFPILHGAGGEDGTLQLQLESLNKPFLGSGAKACALTFDKERYRTFMAEHDVRVPRGEVVDVRGFRTSELRRNPYVLKPVDGGSSVDTLILHDLAREPDDTYFDRLFSRHPQMLLEQLIVGQELTVGVLGDEALPIILIVPPTGEEFDYENKYNGRTQEIVDPEQVPEAVKKRAQELALQLHRLTGCRHLSRSDFIVTPEGELYVLETNTIPGMTAQSLFPKMAAKAGVDMVALAKRFVTMALEV